MIDIIALSRAEMDAFLAGVEHGYAVGWEAGYAACDAELAALQRAAVRNVHALAGRPLVSPEALCLAPDELAALHRYRDQRRGERFRAEMRARRVQGVAS